MKERLDSLRRIPQKVRFFYLAVGKKALHVGMTYRSLYKAINKDDSESIFVADVVKQKIFQVNDGVQFLEWWREHYYDLEDDFVEKC